MAFSNKFYILFPIVFICYFLLAQKERLLALPWDDEFSYINPVLLDLHWSFFLPWHYKPEFFMGHPLGQPLVLWTALHLFGQKIWIAKATALGFSLFCLFSLYKMTFSYFKDRLLGGFSVVLALFFPLFWYQSTLVLGHIPLMAFGFGSLYAFQAKKPISFLFWSLGLALMRESALAFFLPLILQSLFIPSCRKFLFYMLPSVLFFFSHFLIFFIRTGHWIAHPYMYGGLLHNPDHKFFSFSFISRVPVFFIKFFHYYPLLFWLAILFSLFVWARRVLFQKKQETAPQKNSIKNPQTKQKAGLWLRFIQSWIFAPVLVCVLFFCFWIGYPEFNIRNFFPLFILFIPLSVYFIILHIPFSRHFLLALCLACLLGQAFPFLKKWDKAFLFIPKGMRKTERQIKKRRRDTLEAKALISYLELHYGAQISILEKPIFMIWPYDRALSEPFYGYTQKAYPAHHHIFFENPGEYRLAVLSKERRSKYLFNRRVYSFLKNNKSFIKIYTPRFKKFIIYAHKDLL